ncbi:M20 metallopeptidase family protein [Prosthecochloris ethylica]|uniref:M20 metallopeptidase family protein n=1 Tax=Prosthecochloris ethylica TaxID=2743976 RepID=UPI001581DFEB|nr:M20 family metallopeptidase [Prosthecochloris ethylica]NUK47399.1 amidohydrolase [Prosthecochloris ethylica]
MSESSIRLPEYIRHAARELYPGIVSVRRDIHRHPELSFQEFRTTGLIRSYLEGLGLEIGPQYLETGCVALLRGTARVSSSEKRAAVALRADIDALPVQEENSSEFCSTSAGCMHACGHDMHTAILLGTASLLAGMRERIPGDILFIFQPAEEKAPGGARPMLEAGLFSDYCPSAVFALHCFPHIATGNVALREGSLMAAADELYLTVRGQGGHASAPHHAADPILASAHIVTALQHLVSRVASPYEQAVVSVSSIHGGHATNVIPGSVEMSGTMRTMNESLRSTFHERFERAVRDVASAFGTTAEVNIVHGYPVLSNDARMTALARQAAVEIFGERHVEEGDPLMTAEDFSYYLQECPGTFIQLGTGPAGDNSGEPLHSSRFEPDERALETGMNVMSAVAMKALRG